MANVTAWKLCTVGVNQPSTGDIDWVNPGNITATDTTYAVATDNGVDIVKILHGKGFGFNVPATATIVGIETRVSGYKTSDKDLSVSIAIESGGGYTYGTPVNLGFTGSYQMIVKGGATNLFNLNLTNPELITAAKFNDAEFSVVVWQVPIAGTGEQFADSVEARLYYQVNGPFPTHFNS